MKKYIILQNSYSDRIEDQVSEKLEQGYKLHGKLFYVKNKGWVQVMVLETVSQ